MTTSSTSVPIKIFVKVLVHQVSFSLLLINKLKQVGFFKKKPMKRSAATRATSEACLFYIFSANVSLIRNLLDFRMFQCCFIQILVILRFVENYNNLQYGEHVTEF